MTRTGRPAKNEVSRILSVNFSEDEIEIVKKFHEVTEELGFMDYSKLGRALIKDFIAAYDEYKKGKPTPGVRPRWEIKIT